MDGMASSARGFIVTCSRRHCMHLHLHLLAWKRYHRHLQQHQHASEDGVQSLLCSEASTAAMHGNRDRAVTKSHLRGEAGGDAPVDADALWDVAPIGASALMKAMLAQNPGAPCRHGDRPWSGWDACMHAPA